MKDKFLPKSCKGVKCMINGCRNLASHKVGEENPWNQIKVEWNDEIERHEQFSMSHNYTTYICDEHFNYLMKRDEEYLDDDRYVDRPEEPKSNDNFQAKEIELSAIEQMKPFLEHIDYCWKQLDKLRSMVGIPEEMQGQPTQKPQAENNPQPQKEEQRIEVKRLQYNGSLVKDGYWNFNLWLTCGEIPYDKYGPIKQAIEQVLNK